MRARREWRTRAACRSVADPEIFFPVPETGPVYDAQAAVAKAVCKGCPVRAECLDEALIRIPEGIAGGLTPEERRRLRRPLVAPKARRGTRCGEQEAAGRVLLAAGRPVREVARRCGVSERTAARWAARVRALHVTSTAEGSSGGHRAPLLISHTHNPSQGLERRKDPNSNEHPRRAPTGVAQRRSGLQRLG